MLAELRGPGGEVQRLASFPICVTELWDVLLLTVPVPCWAALDAFGLWTLRVSSAARVLAEHSFVVLRYGGAPPQPD